MTKGRTFHGGFAFLAGIVGSTGLLGAASNQVRILQTNSAGDNVAIIDPVTNKVVGQIEGIEANHGVAVAPDGSRIYISDEGESTLDVADAKTLKVVKRVPLSGRHVLPPLSVRNTPVGKRSLPSPTR